jgi:transglutaminase-like putative cysteine protease
VTLWRPLPAGPSRVIRAILLLLWIVQMGLLLRSLSRQSGVALAADLGKYGGAAQWHGVYYRGEKIGFTVSETIETDTGYDIQEEGRLQMTLLGAPTAAAIKTVAHVDRAFGLRSFSFSLDPGSGPVKVEGTLEGLLLHLTIATPSSTRTETRPLTEAPLLSLNLSRRLAAGGLETGKHLEYLVFDPATLRNAPMSIDVGRREVVRAAGRPTPAFRVETHFSGVTSTSFVTDVGEVVREESPTGLFVARETKEEALAAAVPGSLQSDLLEAAAVVPGGKPRIDDPLSVERLRLRLSGADLPKAEMEGAGQTLTKDGVEILNQREAQGSPADPDAARFLAPEAFVESDAPEIAAEVKKALGPLEAPRARAEKLVRYVNALLEKKPTVSLPSALEVLRTRVGDCNEHTVLLVAMARAAGIPARMAVGLVYLHGAFYYHAWAELYVKTSPDRGLWLPVDPTLNQFPADATHLRFARGGLDRQAVILGLMGRLQIDVEQVQTRQGMVPIVVGRSTDDAAPTFSLPHREGVGSCWVRPKS